MSGRNPVGIGMDPKKIVATHTDIFFEERPEALAELLADSLIYLSEHGIIKPLPDLIVATEEGNDLHAPETP